MQEKINELVNLIKRFGYWSDEVLEFNGKLTYGEMMQINSRAKAIVKEERNQEAERTGITYATLIS